MATAKKRATGSSKAKKTKAKKTKAKKTKAKKTKAKKTKAKKTKAKKTKAKKTKAKKTKAKKTKAKKTKGRKAQTKKRKTKSVLRKRRKAPPAKKPHRPAQKTDQKPAKRKRPKRKLVSRRLKKRRAVFDGGKWFNSWLAVGKELELERKQRKVGYLHDTLTACEQCDTKLAEFKLFGLERRLGMGKVRSLCSFCGAILCEDCAAPIGNAFFLAPWLVKVKKSSAACAECTASMIGSFVTSSELARQNANRVKVYADTFRGPLALRPEPKPMTIYSEWHKNRSEAELLLQERAALFGLNILFGVLFEPKLVGGGSRPQRLWKAWGHAAMKR